MATTTARGPAAIRFTMLTAILFGGVGSQITQAQPLLVALPGRGRFTVPADPLHWSTREAGAAATEDRLNTVDTDISARIGEP